VKQSRATSFLKSLVSTIVGFAVAMVANALVLPLFGFTPSLSENFLITCIYTLISVVRGYALERAFEALGWRTRMSAFALAVLAERQRQRDVEGWTIEHDDKHEPGELACAGAAYLFAGSILNPVQRERLTRWYANRGAEMPSVIRSLWRWEWKWWKPSRDDPRRDLVRGCALGIAEGEKFDRARKSKRRENQEAQSSGPLPGALPLHAEGR
jgi:hypothetical protein